MQANQLKATQFNREHVFQDFEGLWSFSWQREDEQIGSLEVGDYFERRPERCEEWKEIHYKYRNTLQIQKYTTNTEMLHKYKVVGYLERRQKRVWGAPRFSSGRSSVKQAPPNWMLHLCLCMSSEYTCRWFSRLTADGRWELWDDLPWYGRR